MSSVEFLGKLLDGVLVEWKDVGEVAQILNGFAFESSKYSSSGIRVIRISDVQKGKMSDKDKKFYPANTADEINKYLLREDDLVMSLTGNVGRVAMLSKTDLPAALNQRVACIRVNEQKTLTRYLFHFFDQVSFETEAMANATGGGQKNMSTKWLSSYKIPIPCPDNPKQSLEIQAEIVRILDAFTGLTAELTAELAIRKEQHRHYQFEMLQFPVTTQYSKIGECCDVRKGLTPIKKATPGKFPLVATTEERQSSSDYQFDCAAVCVPLISSRGHGVASIDRIYFQDGKFALGNILCAIIPDDSRLLSAKFLRHYLFNKKDVLLVPLMRGGANVSLTVDSLKKVEIPIPPMAEQQRIVRILDKFDELAKSLPREIELRQKQYEYYRDLLLSFPKPAKVGGLR